MLSHVRTWRFFAAAMAIAALVPGAAAAQATGTVEGSVLETGSGRPLGNAQVFVAGTTLGALTNGQGFYRITGAPARQLEVRVRLIGYAPAVKSAVVTANQTATVDFSLSVSALQLEQVVVTGSGQAVEVKKLGNTVATIQPPAFAPISSPTELLQGREPGLVGLPSSGLTGEGARIRIRGNASLAMSNEPIVFIDGIRMNSRGDFGPNVGAGGGGSPSRLDDIDPNTIERVEVLKGAAAATLYGTEASNGVIQIFTKKGTSGAPSWTVQGEQSLINYEKDRVKTAYGVVRPSQLATANAFYGRTHNAYDIISSDWPTRLMGTGMGSNVNGTVNGGTQNYTYFVAGRYGREDGPLDASIARPDDENLTQDINRKVSGNLNVGLVPTNNIRLGFRAGYYDTHQETPGNNNNIYATTTLPMFGKPELANCNASSVASPGKCSGPGNEAGNAAFMTARESLGLLTINDAGRFQGVVDATYTPTSNITWTSTIGVDATDDRSFNFQAFGYAVDQFTGFDVNGNRSYDARKDRQYTVDSKFLWKSQPMASLTSDFVVGLQGFVSRTYQIGGYNANFPGPGIEVIGAGNVDDINEFFESTVNGGYFAQEQVSFKNWIHATAGARYDYSSAFGQSQEGVLYPKVSLSVVPSDLAGWTSPLGLNTFRVRGAIGQSGRQPGAFDKFTTYSASASELGSGLAPSNLGNPDLKPEISTEWEVGFETGFMDNRVGIDFTYWDRVVDDVLVAKQFAPSGGFTNLQLANIGKLEAHGYDITGKLFLVQSRDVSFDVFANGAYIFQNVASLGGAAPLKVGGSYPRYRNFIIAGEAPGALLGAKLVQDCSLRPSGATYTCLQPGQLPYDLNGNGVPDTEAEMRAYLAVPRNATALNPMRVDEDGDGDFLDHYDGKPYPDWQGAFGGNLSLRRNWRLSTLFEYRGGNYTVTNLTDAFRHANPLIGRNTLPAARVEQALENPASTVDQRLQAAKDWLELKALSPYDGLNQGEDGSFVRLRELSLTYTAPASLAARVGAKDLAMTLSGRNLFLWTKYPGTDPEVNAIGRTEGGGRDATFLDAVDAFGWPIARRFAFQVRLGF
ncbi:MAG: SusC/RagA family TonB-linked outer membrane protein [Gemmatimonadota bacterium]